jgi:acetyltransferase
MTGTCPSDLTWRWSLPDGTRVVIRPIRPGDREIEQEFVRNLSGESRYFRFMNDQRTQREHAEFYPDRLRT